MKLLWIIPVMALISWSGTALAVSSGVYLGVGAGRTFFEDDERFIGDFLDDDDNGFQFYGGFRFMDYFGIEATYADFGDFDSITSNMEFDAFVVSAVGYLPIRRIPLEVFGKAGFGVVDWDETARSIDDSAGTFSLGFGMAYTPVKPVTLRLGLDIYAFTLEEYRVVRSTVYKREHDQAVGMSYLGIQYNF
ncbi:MAG: outer membrane beta-barrel protein [Desulfurivibrionaceae bacterium]